MKKTIFYGTNIAFIICIIGCTGTDDSSNNPVGGSSGYSLNTSVSPSGAGTVSRNPSASSYAHGTEVTVKATPASGYVFKNWDLQNKTYSANPLNVTLNGSATITAVFAKSGSSTTFSAPSSITGTTYRFNTGVITEAQFRANGYGTMYTSVGSFGIKYQYVKKSEKQASVRMWQYYNNEIRDDRYDDFSMSFEDNYSGKCTHTGESAIGKYGPISGTFERIQ